MPSFLRQAFNVAALLCLWLSVKEDRWLDFLLSCLVLNVYMKCSSQVEKILTCWSQNEELRKTPTWLYFSNITLAVWDSAALKLFCRSRIWVQAVVGEFQRYMRWKCSKNSQEYHKSSWTLNWDNSSPALLYLSIPLSCFTSLNSLALLSLSQFPCPAFLLSIPLPCFPSLNSLALLSISQFVCLKSLTLSWVSC